MKFAKVPGSGSARPPLSAAQTCSPLSPALPRMKIGSVDRHPLHQHCHRSERPGEEERAAVTRWPPKSDEPPPPSLFKRALNKSTFSSTLCPLACNGPMMQTQRLCELLKTPVAPVRAPTGVTHAVLFFFFYLAPHLTCAFYEHRAAHKCGGGGGDTLPITWSSHKQK